jgi:putative DNA methylase
MFFLNGMTNAMHSISTQTHPAYPVTIYYAFKQAESETETGTASTGWETFLGAVLRSGFSIDGTWPMRTELANRMIGAGTNALASSIVLVCRRRHADAKSISRRVFLHELEAAMPDALADMIHGTDGQSPVAPVDLAQAAIGPGMAVFSKYAAVLEADGKPMTVHTALTLINKAIDEFFTQAESDMDADTRFCVDWFQQYGFKSAAFGDADVLARAKGTSVEGVDAAGVLESGSGKVRLKRMNEYPADWDPRDDERVPVWEACHQLCRALQKSETAAGELLAQMADKAEPVRQLAYRLYTICERKGWAEDAGIYNALITSWRATLESSREIAAKTPVQGELL